MKINRFTKLLLDIAMGAVIPIIILNRLTGPLGAIPAYLLAALIPVAWVAIDLFFITRQFNFITAYTGAQAIVRGLLAFWFVDGWLFALKDTAGLILASLVFAVSMGVGRPMMELFWHQGLAPDTPERERALAALTAEPQVRRALVWGTGALLISNVASAVANFILNLQIVTSPFGTESFNQEVARVNAITRIALIVPDLLAFGVAFWLLWRGMSVLMGSAAQEAANQQGDEFWGMIEGWYARRQGPAPAVAPPLAPAVARPDPEP